MTNLPPCLLSKFPTCPTSYRPKKILGGELRLRKTAVFESGSGRNLWLVWGGRRTGSTVCFNIIRTFLSREGCDFSSGYITELSLETSSIPHLVVKAHEEIVSLNPEVLHSSARINIVFTIRRAGEQLASCQRVFPGDSERWRRELRDTILILLAGLKTSFRRSFHFQLVHNDWPIEKKVAAIAHLCSWDTSSGVGPVADEFEISTVKATLDQQFGEGLVFEKNYDQDSHWHAGHVRDLSSRPAIETPVFFLFQLVAIEVLNWLIRFKLSLARWFRFISLNP